MTEVRLKKGETVEKALRSFKKKLDREQTMQQVREHRRFEKPSARRRRKMKAAVSPPRLRRGTLMTDQRAPVAVSAVSRQIFRDISTC